MNPHEVLWVVGAYLVGTLPSTYLVARASGERGRALLAASGPDAGETDPHVLMPGYLGVARAAASAAADVLKGFLFLLAGQHLGRLGEWWLAGCGVAVVLGHAFPFYARRMSGRGMAGAAGVLLVLLPLEMILAGVAILVGVAIRNSGLMSSVGLLSVPVVAAIQGQPGAFVAMSVGILVVVGARRLAGVGSVVATGVSPARAAWYRLVFDSSGAPRRRGA